MMPEERHSIMRSQGTGAMVETSEDKPHSVHTESHQYEEISLKSAHPQNPEKQSQGEKEGNHARESHNLTPSEELELLPPDSTSDIDQMESGETHISHENLRRPESPGFEFQDASLPLDVCRI